MSAEAQDVPFRQYERLCENFRLLRRKYDSLRCTRNSSGAKPCSRTTRARRGLPAVDESLVEEAHRVGDVTTGATLGSGACGSVLEGAWPDGRPRRSRRATTSTSSWAAARSSALKRDETALTSAQQAGVVHGVAAGLAHMHSLDLVHRDVKPENVLLADAGRGGGFWDVRVKLCDLGLSTRVPAAPSPACVTATLGANGREGPRACATRLVLFQCCGSMGFFADMLDRRATTAARAWSLGCLALELAAGTRLFARVWFREYKAFFAQRDDLTGARPPWPTSRPSRSGAASSRRRRTSPATSRRTMGHPRTWVNVKPDESRVPKKLPLEIVETGNAAANRATCEAPSGAALDALKARVEAREEELWLVSSDSKFYARWCLLGHTPMRQAPQGCVLIPGSPTYEDEDGQLAAQSMDSALMLTLADHLQANGIPTIRFDYRGVGKSKGKYNTVTCVRDIVAAVAALCGGNGKTGPCARCVMVAHSMGAANSIGNIYTRGCNKFVSISHGLGFGITLPNGTARDGGQTCKPENNVLRKLYNRTCIFFTTMRISIPKLWLFGGDDHLTPLRELQVWIERYSPGRGDLSTIHTVRGVRHDWRGHELECAKQVLKWITGPAKEIVFRMDFATGPVDRVFE
ncbi:serine/threonine kinase [Aureococcus anophagefferens]|nr:serine/threonine kinase [Aureococcus anophagefferens]